MAGTHDRLRFAAVVLMVIALVMVISIAFVAVFESEDYVSAHTMDYVAPNSVISDADEVKYIEAELARAKQFRSDPNNSPLTGLSTLDGSSNVLFMGEELDLGHDTRLTLTDAGNLVFASHLTDSSYGLVRPRWDSMTAGRSNADWDEAFLLLYRHKSIRDNTEFKDPLWSQNRLFGVVYSHQDLSGNTIWRRLYAPAIDTVDISFSSQAPVEITATSDHTLRIVQGEEIFFASDRVTKHQDLFNFERIVSPNGNWSFGHTNMIPFNNFRFSVSENSQRFGLIENIFPQHTDVHTFMALTLSRHTIDLERFGSAYIHSIGTVHGVKNKVLAIFPNKGLLSCMRLSDEGNLVFEDESGNEVQLLTKK